MKQPLDLVPPGQPLVGAAGDDGFAERDASEPLADARIRPLLERYAAAAGAKLSDAGEGLVELRVPTSDRKAFRNRARVRIAFTVDALERDPDAEIAVVGSPFVEQLIDAIRLRGARVSYGLVPPELSATADAAALGVPVTNGTAGVPQVNVGRHRVVRLLARIVVRAGSAVEEHLAESELFDATTGARMPREVVDRCLSASGGTTAATVAGPELADVVPLHPARPTEELVQLALADLRAVLEPRIQRLEDDARSELQAELRRIDGYYASLLRDSAGRSADDAKSRRIYEAEHERRRAEEERRHQVRAVVHPVQLSEWELVVQRAEWELGTATGHRGHLVAERALSGSGTWLLSCPQCGAANPATLSVCKSDHVACETCALTCGVCSEAFCRDHGIGACHVDGRPTCREHARTCASCREPYCTAHERVCSAGDHAACSTCISNCAICARPVCDTHATMTTTTAPRGARRLCGECVRYCEGGTNEPVGADEVARCVTCGKSVCEVHRSVCAVDQQVHCSRHLRRTDGSRRLVCETHRDTCAFEPGAVLASDEVAPCTSCGRSACVSHSHTCVEDGRRFCVEDAVALKDRPGAYACRAHHTVCHVDGQAYSMAGTAMCPVCDRAACRAHRRSCGWCGRDVCVSELDASRGRCSTCVRLAPASDVSDNLIAAAVAILGERRVPGNWKTARDAHHVLVELDLGWTRRIVFAVRHGDNRAASGRGHSLLGSWTLSTRD